MDPDTFAQLLTEEGQALLAEVHARAGIETDVGLGARLRRTHSPDLVASAVTQNHLRGLSAGKFGADAARMYFTHDAREQATRASVARLRAQRLADSDVTAVLDLGCGIGGDLIAFARAGLRVRGVELDPTRAAIARANLVALGLEGEVITGDLAEVDPLPDEVVFLDPARRDGRGRIFDPASMRPSWDTVVDHLAGRAVVKTLPGISHDLIPDGVEAQWVSDGGDLVEACLWGSGLAGAARRATALERGSDTAHHLVGDGAPGEVAEVGGWLHEPDDAVIRAGLVGELAGVLGGHLIDSRIAWITTEFEAPHAMARSFRIVEELPYRTKALRTALMDRDIGTLTVKKRGVEVVPEKLVRSLRLTGSRTATVVLTRVSDRGSAFLVEPELS